jgi:anti-sigma regulatory factor (Ser/Thr protein kinase)
LLVVYTDGLVERRDESIDEGLQRLLDVVRESWNLPVRELEEVVLQAVAPPERSDDVAIVAVRTKGAAPTVYADCFRAAAEQASPARHRLRAWLDSIGVGADQQDDLTLAAGEAFANAIEHGSPNGPSDVITVEACRRRDEIILSVSDCGTWQAGVAGFLSGRGHGHSIMTAVTDAVELVNDKQGSVVTFRARYKTPADTEVFGVEGTGIARPGAPLS